MNRYSLNYKNAIKYISLIVEQTIVKTVIWKEVNNDKKAKDILFNIINNMVIIDDLGVFYWRI